MTNTQQSQHKKCYFGLLRICKFQETTNPGLIFRHTAITIAIYDAIRNRMGEALIDAQRWCVVLSRLIHFTDSQIHLYT